MSPARKPGRADSEAREAIAKLAERARHTSERAEQRADNYLDRLLGGAPSPKPDEAPAAPESVAPPVPTVGIPTMGTVPNGHPHPYPMGTVPTTGTPEPATVPTTGTVPITGTVKGYTSVPNTIWDELLRTLPVAEQAVYLRLYRLSRGWQRETCSVGYRGLATATNLGKNTAIRCVEKLIAKGLVVRVSAGTGDTACVYRVIEPTVPTTGTQKKGVPISGIPTVGTVPTTGPNKGREKDKENVGTVAVAPAPDKFQIRTRAARIFEAQKGEDGFDHNALVAELRAWARGEGVELDEATIEEATRGMGK